MDFQAQPCPFEGPRYQAADPNPPELWQPGFGQPVMGSERLIPSETSWKTARTEKPQIANVLR